MKLPHRILLTIFFIFCVAMLRLLPHPPNLVPMTAICVFAGAKLRHRAIQVLIPLAAIFATDMIQGSSFTIVAAFVYLAYALIACLGRSVRDKNMAALVPVSLSSTLLFFALSNFGFWIGTSIYPHSSTGLLACYTNALPFLLNSLVADAFYVFAIFGFYSIAQNTWSWMTDDSTSCAPNRNVNA